MEKKTTAGEVTIADIEAMAANYASALDLALAEARALDREIEKVRAKRLPAVRAAAAAANTKREALEFLVEAVPGQFNRPKSRTFHGIKMGFKKQKGKVEIADAEKVVARIHRHFPGLVPTLIKTTETPQKDALAKLTAVELKKLGVTVTEDGDVPFVKIEDTEGEKLLKLYVNGDGK